MILVVSYNTLINIKLFAIKFANLFANNNTTAKMPATGRPTPQNDLDAITEELKRFLKHQHENPSGFFALALQ
jgi:hypothetical protein